VTEPELWTQIDPLPQQLPGPAQPAWEGEVPQHAVSPGPGRLFLDAPDMDECAESNFFRLLLPHEPQTGASLRAATSISLVCPQSWHKKSKRGMVFSLKKRHHMLFSGGLTGTLQYLSKGSSPQAECNDAFSPVFPPAGETHRRRSVFWPPAAFFL
jgi:hypothetical protein